MIWRAVTLFSFGLFGAWAGLQVTNRDPPVTVFSAQAEAPAPPDGTLRIAYTLQRHRQCDTTVDRSIIDSAGTRFVLDTLTFVTGAGPIGQESYVSTIHIPAQATPGPARYRTTALFMCNVTNRLWPIYAPTREVPFEIAASG
ncbi:hypothetical protein KHC28_00505 [Ancylobacter sonchi]|uniref:hypothetical protein n=1 Tax=Ancylobacter sonchi TaxID=1937790 RepID=UPI001BD59223|nr:hypothetical protein [Ancylobacter sonchi]MBS7532146.1 hypothetical protein [Ancylobacter sonchi]